MIDFVPCLLMTKVLKVPGHQQVWCRQYKIYTALIWGIVRPCGVMNLVINGPNNGLLSHGAKQNYVIYQWWKISLNVWFQNVTRLHYFIRSIGKGPTWANFTDTHKRQFYWSYFGYNGYFYVKYTLGKKGCYTPGWCVFFVIISISSVGEV